MSLDISLIDPTATYDTKDLYEANITHNLTTMAEKAFIYKHLWCPEEVEILTAEELIKPLTEGLNRLKDKPEYFKKFNAENSWGTYEQFISFVEEYLMACVRYPKALIEAFR